MFEIICGSVFGWGLFYLKFKPTERYNDNYDIKDFLFIVSSLALINSGVLPKPLYNFSIYSLSSFYLIMAFSILFNTKNTKERYYLLPISIGIVLITVILGMFNIL